MNKAQVQAMLQENILGFWKRMRDPDGGFYGEADFNGVIRRDAPRSAVLCARIAWSYAAAFRAFGRADDLKLARWAGDDFLAHFIDPVYGGAYWSTDASGKPLEDKKQLYAQAFGIYGLSQLYRASGDPRYKVAAAGLWEIVRRHFHDRVHGGYTEALARDFSPLTDMSLSGNDINAPKTMNSHLHLAEGLAELYRIRPDDTLRGETAFLLDLLTGRMTDGTGHLRLYFREDWTPLPSQNSPGHDIETSWLALECAEALGDRSLFEALLPRCRRLADAGNAIVRSDGSLEGNPEWWVYAEMTVGNLWLSREHHDAEARIRAQKILDFIRVHLTDPDGEWYWSLRSDGTPDPAYPKAGFWKCPYHNSRMCLEILRDFRHFSLS